MTSLDHLRQLALTRRSVLKGIAGSAAGIAAGGVLLTTPELAAARQMAGGRLIVGKPYELTGFDPHPETDQTSWEIHALVYESLIFLDGELNPLPGLAESWETPNETTYVFKIREGVRFHNGREMTAEDVAFSLNRVLNPATAAWWATRMGPSVAPSADEVAAAATAVAQGTPVAAGPSIGLTIEATGPYQVTATLSEPYGAFLQALSPTVTSIVPAAEVLSGELDLTTTLLGTGPYKVVDHAEDQSWTFAKHTEYWNTGKPMADELVWNVIPDEAARVAGLRAGDLHITAFENPVMLNLAQGDANVEVFEQVTTNVYLMFVNARHPELADQRVRQAISKAIDRQQIVDLAMFGRANVSGPVPAGFSTIATPVAELANYSRDVEGAKALLAEAGFAEGTKIRLLILSVLTSTIPMAEVIKEQLAEVGIEIEIEQRDIATFVQEYAIDFTAMLTITWYAGFSDPYLFLLNFRAGATGPFVGAQDTTQIDPLLGEVSVLSEPEARVAKFHEIETLVATEAYFQFLATRNNFVAWRKDLLQGVTILPSDGFGLPYWHQIQDISVAQ